MDRGALAAPLSCEVQADGRIRVWYKVERNADLADATKSYILRVVTLEDGETAHNAFFDRSCREAGQ